MVSDFIHRQLHLLHPSLIISSVIKAQAETVTAQKEQRKNTFVLAVFESFGALKMKSRWLDGWYGNSSERTLKNGQISQNAFSPKLKRGSGGV